ncbi:adenylate kinase domain-containing protein [Ditylenchus destructor]|uniref:UMP-CMP kinase n=1 Tax=Ditylenchus destructor TaxID=166010 RepID=A0AAD4RDY9_9BILA|nr:adenylate kinase domain-containing protein [Ditylenchus destructor]
MAENGVGDNVNDALKNATYEQTTSTQKQFHNVVFVLGPPGSGKGTQCEKIQKNFGFTHLSAGELLRNERMRPDAKYGELIETNIRNGTIVPVEITCKLIENEMIASKNSIGFLVDGFPRNQDNVDGWQRTMSEKVKLHFVLYITAPVEICVQRCLNRGQGRSDDNDESVRKRIVTYNSQTIPIIKHYADQNLVREVNGTGSPDEIYCSIKNIFQSAGFKPIHS